MSAPISTAAHATVSAVVVSFSDPAATCSAVDSLVAQTAAPLEILLIDNHPEELLARSLQTDSLDPRVRLIHRGGNLGYTEACNLAATQARGEWLFFLNPDARAEPDCVETLLSAVDDRTAVVGAQVLLPDGRTNAGHNPVHVTGISWAGRYGEVAESGAPRAVAAVSGAALLSRTNAFAKLGGLCPGFFLYQDDVDLCWRARLAGYEVKFCPAARVWHGYEFDKGTGKWYWLERNRLWSVLSNYSLSSLILLAPMLLGTELAVLMLAVRDGWMLSLLRAWGATLRGLPSLLRWRARVQQSRRVPDSVLLALMAGRFDTPLLDSPAARRANPVLVGYRAVLIRLLNRAGR